MAANGDGGRLRAAKVASSAEDAIQTLMDKGEQDLALKREARARARKLRFEELQRQKENEEQEGGNSQTSHSRRNVIKMELEDSLPQDPAERLVAINQQLKDTLLTNSQLHTDKMQLVYQLDACKDSLEDYDQEVIELRHYNRTTKQDLAVSQHQLRINEQQLVRLRQEVEARDSYLKEKNIAWPPPEKPDEVATSGQATPSSQTADEGANHQDMARPLSVTGDDELGGDDRKKRTDAHTREKQYLLDQIGRLKQEVILLKNEQESQALSSAASENGGLGGRELMRDTARLLGEYKAKLLAVETDKTRLEGQMQRAEAQVKRLRAHREEAEKLEDELKSERRKLHRDVRSAESKAEELELENERLQKRIEALRKRHQKD